MQLIVKSLRFHPGLLVYLLDSIVAHNIVAQKMLVLNVAKSKLMLFFKSPKRRPKLRLTINGDIIEQVKEFNLLGITFDQNVTWDAHLTKISIILARVIGL